MDWGGNIVEIQQRGYFGDASLQYRYEYDALGRKRLFIDTKGIWTSYRYDERNLLIEQTYGEEGLSDQMRYDDAGRLIHKTDRKGHVLAMTYDELGRNTAVLHYENEGDEIAGILSRAVRTVFDFRGNPVRISSESLIEYYEYDAANRVTCLDRRIRKRINHLGISGPMGVLEDLDYTYSAAGNVLSINDSTYSYDGYNRLSSAQTKLPESIDVRKLVAATFGTYEAGSAVNGAVYDIQADLNEDGRVNGYDDIMASYEPVSGQYDDERFIYDENGNRTSLIQNGDEYMYEYGQRNQLTRILVRKAGASEAVLFSEYEYDANGNTILRRVSVDGTVRETEFQYDTLNRLVSTTSDGKTTKYAYDNAGNRLYKTEAEGLTLYIRHGNIAVAMDIHVFDDTVQAEKGERGEIARYVLSGDLLAGRVVTKLASDGSRRAIRSYYHLDHQNSTRLVSDETGATELRYEYRAFGEQLRRLNAVGSNVDDLARYSYGGKELDDDTKLYYFNARYYDATTGRFINVDPIQDGSNWYVYCENNPLVRTDSTGLFWNYVGGAVIGGVTSGLVQYSADTLGNLAAGKGSDSFNPDWGSIGRAAAGGAVAGAVTSGLGAVKAIGDAAKAVGAVRAAVTATGAMAGTATTTMLNNNHEGKPLTENLGRNMAISGVVAGTMAASLPSGMKSSKVDNVLLGKEARLDTYLDVVSPAQAAAAGAVAESVTTALTPDDDSQQEEVEW